MTMRTSPTGHVLLSVLADRLLGSSRGSCNKNIQSQLDTSPCTHIQLYIHIQSYIYMHCHIQPNLYLIHPYVNNHLSRYLCTHVLMYSCTDVLLYSCTHIVNVYDTATVRRLYLRNNTSVYILYISGPTNNLKISNTPTECPHPHLGIV